MPSAEAPFTLAMRADGTATVHGTAVACGDRALLLVGPSGAGKSTLAAELLAIGFELLADDIVLLTEDEGAAPLAQSPLPDVAARIELRGIGIVTVPQGAPAPVAGIVALTADSLPPRLPEPEAVDLLSATVPLLRHPYVPGALAAKLRLWFLAPACASQ